MAVEVVSPRISFSHDLRETDFVPIESHSPQSDLDFIDFDFSIGDSFSLHLSSADELFANGKILPVEVKKSEPRSEIHQSHQSESNPAPNTHKIAESGNEHGNEDTVMKKKTLIELLSNTCDEEEKPPSKPFWQFRRSTSLNTDNGLLRSLKFLSRSNSTGSTPNPKPKVIQKQNSMKEASSRNKNPSSNPSNSSIFSENYSNFAPKKPPLNKSASRSYGNGIRVHINPVLNIPPTYIAKGTVNLFGLGSLFCNGKSRKKKR